MQVPIVIIAEDGVTSLRYYVSITRAEGPAPGPAPEPDGAPPGPEAAAALREGALEESSLSPAEPLAETVAAYSQAAALATQVRGTTPGALLYRVRSSAKAAHFQPAEHATCPSVMLCTPAAAAEAAVVAPTLEVTEGFQFTS